MSLARIFLAILGFATPVTFILYLVIPSIRSENTDVATGIGLLLGILAIFGIAVLIGLAKPKDEE